jgi:hypothetical protein
MTPRVVVVDYSRINCSGAAHATLPAKRSGKFVQIRHGETEYLVLSTREISPYHADILERFCRERDIDGAYEDGRKRFSIHDAEWVILGGGKFEIDEDEGYIRLYDNSMAYGRFDWQGLRERVCQSDMLEGYEVIIE